MLLVQRGKLEEAKAVARRLRDMDRTLAIRLEKAIRRAPRSN